MKIQLVQPKAYRHNPLHVYEPLGLGYIAAYLRTKGYSDVDIATVAFQTDEQIISRSKTADVIGFTATSPMMTHGRQLARQIRKVNPSSVIVFGGAHPSVAPASTLEDDSIDFVVRGEGEITFAELVKTLETGEDPKEIDGVSFRIGNGALYHTKAREQIGNLDSIPFPARDLMKQKNFSEKSYAAYKKSSAWVLSSRGCPFKCTYCASNAIWTRTWRPRSAKNILSEAEDLSRNHGIEHINFADDTFTVNRQRCLEFCDLLMSSQLDITWACNVHAKTVDRELLGIMKQSGCVEIWVGVESGSQKILDELHKGVYLSQIKDVFRNSRDIGIRRHAYLMIGSPSESQETVKATKELVRELDPDYAAVTIFTPYPGSDIYNEAKTRGYVSDNMDWSVVDLHHDAVMPTEYMSQKQLLEEHKNFENILARYQRITELSPRELLRLVIDKLRRTPVGELPKELRRVPKWALFKAILLRATSKIRKGKGDA